VSLLNKRQIIIVTLIISLLFISNIAVAKKEIYFNNENITNQVSIEIVNDELIINAEELATLLDLNFSWRPALKSLVMESEDVEIKTMANSRYIQVGNDALKTEAGLQIINKKPYIPLSKSIINFGYYLKYNEKDEIIYINQIQNTINSLILSEDKTQIKIKMDKIPPYRILFDGRGRMVVEIYESEIKHHLEIDGFGKNYIYDIEEITEEGLVKITLNSRTSFQQLFKGDVTEKEKTIIINLVP